jgi:hypothetical protein
MKLFIVRSLAMLCYLGFFGFILGGSASFYYTTAAHQKGAVFAVVELVMGGIVGFIAAVIVFGFLFLMLDIADNTRRTRELLERRP